MLQALQVVLQVGPSVLHFGASVYSRVSDGLAGALGRASTATALDGAAGALSGAAGQVLGPIAALPVEWARWAGARPASSICCVSRSRTAW